MNEKTIDLGYQARPWQRKVHDSLIRFNVLALHRRAGKTEVAIMELIDKAIKFDKENGFFIYLAPFLKQAVAIAWGRFKSRLEPLVLDGAVEIREGDKSIVFKHNNAIIRMFGDDNNQAMRGLRVDGAVIDEVAQVHQETWDEILQPAMSDRLGWALFIGTPNGVNLFSQLFYAGTKMDDWYCARWTVDDTDAINPDEIARLKEQMPENSYAREYLCDFSASADDQLISLNEVLEATSRGLTKEDVDGSAKVLGVDVARYGGDRSCIFPRQGLIAYKPKVYQGVDNMTLAGYVADAINKWQPDLVLIDAGRGEGVIDRLRQLGHIIIEVNFGSKPMDDHYNNKRSEMWDTMRHWLNQGGMIPDNHELQVDLCTPTYSYNNAANKFALESKDSIRKRDLPSPDLGDALALTFAYPSPAKPAISHTGVPFDHAPARTRTSDYNPIDNI